MTRLGIVVPDLGALSPREFTDCARAAEDAGFESLWMSDYRAAEVFSALSACAVATSRIKLGSSVAIVFYRDPVTIALAAATIDSISQGRLLLGLGQGHKAIVERQKGIPFANSSDRLTETEQIVRALLGEGRVHHRGKLFNVDFELGFEPYRRSVPIYFPSLFPKSMDLAGRTADGILSVFSTLDRASFAARTVKESAKAAGRDPEELDIGCLLLTVLTHDEAAGLRLVKGHLARYVGSMPRYRDLMAASGFLEVEDAAKAYKTGGWEAAAALLSDDMARAVAIIGDEDYCRERISEYRAAGVDHPIVYPAPLPGQTSRECFSAALRLAQ